MQNELDSANNTLSTLHAQLMDLQQSDTIFRVKQNHEESVSSLRERHEKELFRLHQEIIVLLTCPTFGCLNKDFYETKCFKDFFMSVHGEKQ